MKMLIDFLSFCVKREQSGRINYSNSQNNFDIFYREYQKNKDNSNLDKYKEILDTIVQAHENILNKKDESAMDYIEKGYTKILTNNSNKGYKLNEDDGITKLGSAAFITTAIVLQGTLLLAFVLSLFTLVK